MKRSRTTRSQHSVLEDVAESVKSRFIAEVDAKRRRFGGKAYQPRDESWDWLSLARFILQHQLPMAQWVNWVVNNQPVPRPSNLKSDRLLRRYQESQHGRNKQAAKLIGITFEGDKARAQAELELLLEAVREGDLQLTRREILVNVVGNHAVELTPLFRYCWCVDQDLFDLAEEFFTPAICQYSVHPRAYDKVFKGWIPESFREQARQYC